MRDEPRKLIAIVEGEGDVSAVPGLLRRVLGELHGRYDILVPRPIRAKGGGGLVKRFEDLLHYALSHQEGCHAILVMVDTDTEDCPKELAVSLADRACILNLGVPVSIVCPNSEYEAWFICTLAQDRGQGLRNRLRIEPLAVMPENVETIRDAKAWLTGRMPGDSSYSPTSHQAALTHHIDIDLVLSRPRSFRRLCHAAEQLIEAMNSGTAAITPDPLPGVHS